MYDIDNENIVRVFFNLLFGINEFKNNNVFIVV